MLAAISLLLLSDILFIIENIYMVLCVWKAYILSEF